MINKQSSNDEVLHHLKQTELMLMTSEEEQGLNKVLEIEDMLKLPKVKHWVDDGFFSDDWLSSTEVMVKDVKKRLLKNHVIKEHLAQCRGFVAYNILISKLENNDMRLIYQNGEWFFVFLNERKEQESWVNQRFNSCFFNSNYEKKFIELIKETNPLEVNKAWIYQREDWFYTSELFEDLNAVCKKINYDDIKNSKAKTLKIKEDLPPIDEPLDVEIGLSLSVTETVSEPNLVSQIVASSESVMNATVVDNTKQVEVAVKEAANIPIPVPIKSSANADDIPFGDDVPFVQDMEDLPPIDDFDETGGLFPSQREVIDVIVETQDIPIKLDFGFDESESGTTPKTEILKEDIPFNEGSTIDKTEVLKEDVFLDVISKKDSIPSVNEIKVSNINNVVPPIANKSVSISPVAAKIEKKVVEVESKPVRALFGSRGSMAKKVESDTNEVIQESVPIKAENNQIIEKKKGFSPFIGGKKITSPLENESYLGDNFSENDE